MTATDTAEVSAMVLDQADRLFNQHVTRAVLQQADEGVWPEALWREVEQAGLPLALVPEDDGGSGLPVAAAMRLVRLAAYHCVPMPVAETMLAQSLWCAAGGTPLPGTVTLGPTQPGAVTTLQGEGPDYRLFGRLDWVPWGGSADHVLLLAKGSAGDQRLVVIGRGAMDTQSRRSLAAEPRDSLVLDGVAVMAAQLRAAPSACAAGMLPLGAFLRVQQMVGAMQRCLDWSVAYAGTRIQFGRPIAKFQAVQHMLAVAAGQVASATAVADQCLESYDTAGFEFAVALAKARCGEASGQVTGVAHQVHAAMGFTQELPLHFATRRLWSWREEFGTDSYWQEHIGRLVCAGGGAALWTRLVGD